MNPENRGEHIVLRHSLLWKNPLVYEKPVKQSNICHLQLNQLGADGQLWRTRNSNFNSTFTFKKKTHVSKGKKTVDASVEDKHMSISAYVPDSVGKIKGMKLVDGMQKMRHEKTIEASCVTLAPYPGVGRMPFVINDYHPKVANPNYSRNSKGKHFTS